MANSDGRKWFAEGYFATGYWNPNYWPGAGSGGGKSYSIPTMTTMPTMPTFGRMFVLILLLLRGLYE